MLSRKSDCGLPEIRIKAPSVERGAHYYHNHHSGGGSGSLSKHWSYEQVDRYWSRPLTMRIAHLPPSLLMCLFMCWCLSVCARNAL